MAKTSLVFRNLKRVKMAEKHANCRQKQKDIIHDPNSTLEEKWNAQLKLQALPKNSAPCRIKNRCKITGRSRGYHRRFGIARVELRRLAGFGEIPGLCKSSW